MNELQEILRALPRAPACVLATLVKAEGSSYRRPGARLLWMADGARHGSISGGCLEEDVIAHAAEVLADGRSKTVVYDTTAENEEIWGVGLGCHGIVRVLLEKLPGRSSPALGLLAGAVSRREAVAFATVFQAEPAESLGVCLALAASGGVSEALPAPAWREPFLAETRAALAADRSHWRRFEALPGRPEVFFELIPAAPALVICGAGEDARPLARLAGELGWRVTVADPRAAFATRERFPGAEAVIVTRPEAILPHTAPGARSFAVVMTHHYRHDVPFLRALLPHPFAGIGLLGPKKRAEKILADLARDGLAVTPEMRARLRAPAGLDLGAATPEEVALAILAELQAALAGRDARPLRERTRPIHG